MSPIPPEEKDFLEAVENAPAGEREAFTKYFQFASKRYHSLRNKLIVFGVILSLGTAFGLYETNSLSNDRANDNASRNDQICGLIITRHNDRVKQYNDTLKYLATPAGQEKTGINDYIRVQLPQNKSETTRDQQTIPKFCLDKYGKNLKKINQ